MAPRRAIFEAGDLLADRYCLERIVGRGSTAIVWRARDVTNGDAVALKCAVPRPQTRVPVELARAHVRNEGETASQVRHRAFVSVREVLEHEGVPVLVMEYVDGPSLSSALRHSRHLTRAEVAWIGAEAAEALAEAHELGLSHGDISPANLLLPPGRVVLIDMGLPGNSDVERRLGLHLADPDFAAPERLQGWPSSPASDVWSLAATLYSAIEEVPRGPAPVSLPLSTEAIVRRNRNAPVFSKAGPLAPLLATALADDPFARPSTAHVAEQLRELAALLGTTDGDEQPEVDRGEDAEATASGVADTAEIAGLVEGLRGALLATGTLPVPTLE
ncbi:MAG: protein kinase domain-containing protein [Actinomycetales bacterium]